MKKFLVVFLLTIFCLGFQEGFAQYDRLKRSKTYSGYNSFGLIQIGGGVGIAMYYGDLCTTGDCSNNPKPALNLGGTFRLNDRFQIRGDFNYYNIGNDKDQYEPRNLTFFSHNFELTAGVNFDILRYSLHPGSRPVVIPYLFAGIGVTYFDPRAEYEGATYRLRPCETEGVAYSPVALVIPFGGGISYSVGMFTDLTLEVGYRITSTDYLDDVSTVYQDPALFNDDICRALADRSGEIGRKDNAEGSQRGNPDSNDGYFMASLKVEFTLANKRSGAGGTNKSSGVHLSKMSKKYRKKMMKRRR